MTYTATFSPEDNKIRLSASSRLDKETYQRVRDAGFIWAPKQEIFVAPMWTPEREDLAIELAGEIEDEDKSLVERAEERAERFEDYSDSRKRDADQAHKQVERICDGIPLGQPILVGHHSEKHARKDAERIDNGMRRAVKMWETSQYWQQRARGAIRAAKYKELPAVRARRIKGLEADKRRIERDIEQAETFTKLWSKSLEYDPEVRVLTREQARAIANYDRACSGMCFPLDKFPRNPPASQYEGAMGLWSALGDSDEQAIITPEQARTFALAGHARTIAHSNRWLQHVNNRLEYERAMLADGGGLKAEGFDIQIGGRVLRRGEWMVVTKLNKRDGVLNSVSVIGHWASTVPVEEITDYKPPADGDAAKVKAVTTKPPLVNYRAPGCIEMTMQQWKDKCKWSDSNFAANFDAEGKHTYGRVSQGETAVLYRQRSVTGKEWKRVPVFITDAKVVEPPKAPTAEPVKFERQREPQPVYQAPSAPPEAAPFEAMRETLKAGIQVVSAPQLFPTPPELAERMVYAANLHKYPALRILEPSAGTGNILTALRPWADSADILAVEIDGRLCEALSQRFNRPEDAAQSICKNVLQADFLECNGNLGTFDRVIMNPPFKNAEDIDHIKNALRMLRSGGRLVAICANGPRQQAQLKPIVDEAGGTWEPLPADTFKESGTGVNTVLLVIDAPAEPEQARMF